MLDLITATGKTFKSDYFVALNDPPMLFLRVIGQDIDTIQTIFSDPAETSCLTYGGKAAFGYTTLHSISREGDALKVTLMK